VPVVDLRLSSLDRQAEIGALADDAYLARLVEPVGDAAHFRALLVPVQQAGTEEEVLQLRERHPRVLRQRRRRVLAADPRDVHRHRTLVVRTGRCAHEALALGGQFRAVARVLRRVDRDARVDRLDGVQVGGRELVEQLRRRGARPRVRERELLVVEVDPQQRIGAALPDQLANALDERPCPRSREDEHLPAGLDVHATLDQQPRVLVDAGVH
jgi:hypothetical protein